MSKGQLSESELQAEFRIGRPVVIYVHPKINGYGHFVVLSGYNTETHKYTILDPCNTFKDVIKPAKIKYASYENLSNTNHVVDEEGNGLGTEPTNVWLASMTVSFN